MHQSSINSRTSFHHRASNSRDKRQVLHSLKSSHKKPIRNHISCHFCSSAISVYDDEVCQSCNDSGFEECKMCAGHGLLAPGGFSKTNSINFSKVVGTNWTALRRTKGWRHFECTEKRVDSRQDSRQLNRKFVTLSATCDRTQKIEVELKELKDRSKWASGWQQKEDIEWEETERDVQGALIGKPKRTVPCLTCAGEGKVRCANENCVISKKIKKQELIEVSVETRFKAAIRNSFVDDLETKRKMKKIVKDLAKKKKVKTNGKAEKRREIERTLKENDVETTELWADLRNLQRDEQLENWLLKTNKPNEEERE